MTILDVCIIITALFNIGIGIIVLLYNRKQGGCIGYVSLTLGLVMLIAEIASQF